MNPEFPNSVTKTSARAVFLFAALALLSPAIVPSALAHELKDIELIAGPGQTYLKVSFSGNPSEGEYPLYFQKTDQTRGTITLSFLETETAFPLGRHALDTGSPALEEIQLRKMTSPSGKTFLGLELKLKEPPMADALLQPVPKGALKIIINNSGKKKFAWSLSKALHARDNYLSTKAAPAPVTATAAPASAAGPAKAGKKGKGPAEDVTFEAPESSTPPDPATPEASPASGASPAQGASPVSEATPASGSTPSEPKPMNAGAQGKIKVAPMGRRSEPIDGVKSALDEGASLDATVANKGLSSSKVFSIGGGSKPMVLTKDSAAMKDKPGPDGKTLKKIAVGEKVVRLEGKAGWNRVVSGSDTGYLRATDAVYADEITKTQEKGIQDKLAAKAAKVAAAEAKVAAAEAKRVAAEAKAAAKVEAKAEAARKQAEAKAEVARKQAEATAAAAQAKQQKADQKLVEAGTANGGQALAQPVSVTQAQPAQPSANPTGGNTSGLAPKLAIADNPELADKLAKEKKAAEDEKMRVEPEENRITYNSYGRRDPFIPVEQGSTDNGIDIDQMKVVGIIWQSSEPMAVLEHTREANVSFTVKQGDPVHNGRVARITREGVTFDISEYGISRSYSLKLVSSKEGTKK